MTIEAHMSSVRVAEHDKQGAMVPGLNAAQAKEIDVAYHRARLASALATGVSPSVSLQALRGLGAEMTEPVPPSATPHLAPDQLPTERPSGPRSRRRGRSLSRLLRLRLPSLRLCDGLLVGDRDCSAIDRGSAALVLVARFL